MKAREIYKKIRKIYMRNILLPIAAIVFPLGLLVFLPFDKVLEPKVVSSTEEAIEAIEEGYEYLEISMTRLIYSGYDYMRDEDVYGQYYYDLVDGKECLFYLLKPENEINRETYIYGVNKKVKVEETNGIFNNMLSMFSNSIGWTEEGVKDITKEYILSEVSYHYNVFLLLYILLLATLIYGVALLIYSFLVIAFPILCPRIIIAKWLFKSGRHSSLTNFVRLVARETEDENAINIGSMYITKHFILNMDTKDFDLVPIDRIIIAYEHSTLKSFLGMHLKVSYTLHLKCSKLMRFHISRKTLEEANSVLDYIRENKPDTLVGYTNENKELVKEIVNSK
ncbi:MAG: DUF6709 family protein [Lachnospiraceae bacterium]|nr:hypothetical protein [Lachnospiraceae bacterium]MEE0686449.1 DUF6709 family protein [Lachnospiraceae bacterium]